MSRHLDRWFELLSAIGIAALLLVVWIILQDPGANQYEISLYQSYPPVFWIALGGAFVIGMVIIIGNALNDSAQTWWVGAAIAGLANVILFTLPILRGYFMYGRSDALSHLGFIREISETGSIGSNIYPPLHLVGYASIEATGLSPSTVGLLIPPVIGIFYFGALVAFVIYFLDSREGILLVLPFSLLPILRHAHLGLRPFDVSVMLVPLVFLIFVRSIRTSSRADRATLVVVLLAVLLYHALTAFFLVILFGIYSLWRYAPTVSLPSPTPTNVFSLSVAFFLAWYSNFSGIVNRFYYVYGTFADDDDGNGSTRAEAYAGTVDEAAPAMIDLAQVAFFRYGLELLLIGLGSLAAGVLVFRLLVTEERIDPLFGMFVTGILLFGFGGSLFLLLDLIVPPERPFQFAKLGSVILLGWLLKMMWAETNPESQSAVIAWSTIVVILVVVLVVLGLFSLYPSPMGSEGNPQVTEMEVAGSSWLLNHSADVSEVDEFEIRYWRYHHAAHGVSADQPFLTGNPIPRFNYTEHDRYGSNFEEDRFLTITRLGRLLYPETFPNYEERWRFHPEDFERLERDESINRVYDNGDYTQYYVRATGPQSDGP